MALDWLGRNKMSRKNKLMKLTMLITVALAVAIYADIIIHGVNIL